MIKCLSKLLEEADSEFCKIPIASANGPQQNSFSDRF